MSTLDLAIWEGGKMFTQLEDHMNRLILTVAALMFSVPAFAQDHSGHSMPAASEQSPATEAYRQANMRMHEAMDVPYTGNADADFVLGMIPHHQGAVEMARIVLEHGSDPDVRKLAEDVIKTQEAEIAWMREWLAENGY